VLIKTGIGFKADYIGVGKKQLLDRLGKNTSQGFSFKDTLLDETVVFKTGIGLTWFTQGAGKNSFWNDRAKILPMGRPLKTPSWTKPFCSKPESDKIELYWAPEKSI